MMINGCGIPNKQKDDGGRITVDATKKVHKFGPTCGRILNNFCSRHTPKTNSMHIKYMCIYTFGEKFSVTRNSS